MDRYAPAYERFGSQISAIHFIGPNKPWNSLPYRAPGTSAGSATQTQNESQIETSTEYEAQNKSTQTESVSRPSQPSIKQAYDYGSLVDRWYAVYDSHYRSQVLIPESSTQFEVKKYASVWDEHTSPATQSSASSEEDPAGGAPVGTALGLEDLRRLAVEGMGSARSGGGEGEYRSMPLDGRVDLMRPKEPEQPDEDPTTPVARVKQLHLATGGGDEAPGSPVRMWTFPTPRPDELPSAPYLGGHSLPPTPLPPLQWHQRHDESSPSPSDQDQQHHHEQQQQQQQQQQH